MLNTKLKLFYLGRKNLIAKIRRQLKDNKNELFWVHCASVGEFEQGLPVIELLKKEHPTWKVVVTFFSPSGYEAINHESIDYKFYLPLDTPSNARAFLDAIKPKVVLFIKYEFWCHFLNAIKNNHIPTYSVSSIFRPTQTFFKWHGSWNHKMLLNFTYFMVQDKTSVTLLNSIGLSNVQITGDTRFDRVLKLKEDTIRFPEIEKFIDGRKVFIVGSLRPEDDTTILPFVNSNKQYVFLIAPHEITEKHISKIEKSIKGAVRHSNLTDESDTNVLIIDSIGKLSRLYRLAHFAYIGGGFSDGIHNILEPAVHTTPLFFGNRYFKKYKEATDLIKLNAAFPVSGPEDLQSTINKLENSESYALISSKMEDYVKNNQGAAEKVVNIINQQESR